MAGPDQAAQHSSEILHQRKNLGKCPIKMGIGGMALAAGIGYMVLCTKKKAEATALDVAKVTTGLADPHSTRPRT